MGAPKVVAKGAGLIVAEMRYSQKHAVLLVENKPLAQSLYRAVEVGDDIPASFIKQLLGSGLCISPAD